MSNIQLVTIMEEAMTQLEYAKMMWQDMSEGYFEAIEADAKKYVREYNTAVTRMNLLGDVLVNAYQALDAAVHERTVSA